MSSEEPGTVSQNTSNRNLAPVRGRRRGGRGAGTYSNRRRSMGSPSELRARDLRSGKNNFLGVGGDRMKTQSEVTTRMQFNKSARELFRLIDLDLNGVLSSSEIQR